MKQKMVYEMLDEARVLRNVVGDQKLAIKACDRILKIDPENRDAMLIKAGALSELGKPEEFVELVQNVINKWPEHWEAYYLLSIFYFKMHENNKALDLMERSIKLEKNFDNVMSYAHILYLVNDQRYMEYIDEAKKLNKARAENFLKNVWVWDLESVKPTFRETMRALKTIKNWKKVRGKLKIC